ncbi:RNA polymerase sigma factor [Streptomyces sp. NPDC020917]|uniref:RNA polymerase sigma factor n=1 Tax=Streptomyces sp. NPDC020917 TaxID=3365102 RepID=UPI003789A78A
MAAAPEARSHAGALTGAAAARKPPFEEVVAAYGPMVLRVVRAVLGPHDAEDAWSETFLAALGAYPELPADANVEAWLVTVAHRKAVDVTRGNARRPAPVGAVPDRPAATGRPDDRDPDLWQALAALPERQRHAVAYHYLAGLPYREIAALTGGSTDAARRAAADGMKTLRRTYPHPPSTEES